MLFSYSTFTNSYFSRAVCFVCMWNSDRRLLCPFEFAVCFVFGSWLLCLHILCFHPWTLSVSIAAVCRDTKSLSTHFTSQNPSHGINNGVFQDISPRWKLKMTSPSIAGKHLTEQERELMIVRAVNIPRGSRALLSTSADPFPSEVKVCLWYRQMQAEGITTQHGWLSALIQNVPAWICDYQPIWAGRRTQP